MAICKICGNKYHWCSSCSLTPSESLPYEYSTCSESCMLKNPRFLNDLKIFQDLKFTHEQMRYIRDEDKGVIDYCIDRELDLSTEGARGE